MHALLLAPHAGWSRQCPNTFDGAVRAALCYCCIQPLAVYS
jgi:hypothetical protein